jgi:hypothetical protein
VTNLTHRRGVAYAFRDKAASVLAMWLSVNSRKCFHNPCDTLTVFSQLIVQDPCSTGGKEKFEARLKGKPVLQATVHRAEN